MRNSDDANRIVRRALEVTGASQAQALLWSERLELTRYAGNKIHQSTVEEDDTLYLTAVVDGREGTGSTNRLDDDALCRLAEAVVQTARSKPQPEDLPPLPGPQSYPEVHAFEASTALWSPDQRAEAIQAIVGQAQPQGLTASGAYHTAVQQVSIANTSGLEGCHARTAAGLTAVVQGETGSGYGDGYSRNASHIQPLEIAETALSKAVLGANPSPVEPGEYDVVLEPNAVAGLVMFLAYMGLSGKAVQEGRSFMSGRQGEQVTGELVTLTEDPLSPDGLYSPFDYEGTPRQRVELISRGVAVGPVHDLQTAHAAGIRSTGHAVHPGARAWSDAPMPISMFMDHSEIDMDEIIASVARGLLITRFHYMNVVQPVKTAVTGMTRDGAFLIEHGRITRPVTNLRFVENILDAFGRIELIGRERKLVHYGMGALAVVVPALRIRRFRFTGASTPTA